MKSNKLRSKDVLSVRLPSYIRKAFYIKASKELKSMSAKCREFILEYIKK